MSELNDPRVLFAAERTLLAWNRTSLAIAGFGFVVERSGLLLGELDASSNVASLLPLTFWLGLLFIALGAFTAGYSAKQYAVVLRTLNAREFPPGYSARWGMVVNALVCVLALLLMIVLTLGRA